jgi:WD40 repeat protein/serine/threonine protein kinase
LIKKWDAPAQSDLYFSGFIRAAFLVTIPSGHHPMSDLVCSQCGARLRGSSPRGLCPSCVIEFCMETKEELATTQAALDSEWLEKFGLDVPKTSSSTSRAFADFELIEEIGRGGMGVVYKARQRSPNRLVALKMIAPNRLALSHEIQRFQMEVEAAARLEHPNILPVYEVGEHQGQHFFTMRLVEGGNLAEHISEFGLPKPESSTRPPTSSKPAPLPRRPVESHELQEKQKRIASLIATIARAVACAHQYGILHRDLKPANILLETDGRPYVTDFGVAKFLNQDGSVTQTVGVIGTPGYMAPEQASGQGERLSTAADVYGLGAILYALLTGQAPFKGESSIDVLRRVMDEPPKPPRLFNRKISPDLETICLKCLQKEPARRYPNAQTLAEDLERWIEGKPISARPVNTTERLWLWCRRKPALATLGALVLTLLVVVAIGSSIAAFHISNVSQGQAREQYYANIALADSFIRDGDVDRALEILYRCPAKYRNWEWGRLIYLCHQDVLSLSAHPAEYSAIELAPQVVQSLQFSPNGDFLLTRGIDGTIKVWDSKDGGQLFAFGARSNRVNATTFNPKQPELVLAGDDGIARVFRTGDWKEIKLIQHGTQPIVDIQYDPDGLRILTRSKTSVGIWASLTGKEICVIEPTNAPLNYARFTPDPTRIQTSHGSHALIWDATSGKRLTGFGPNSDKGLTTSFAADTTNFVAWDADNRMTLWRDDQTSIDLGVIKGSQPGTLRRGFWSKDHRYFCNAGELGTARVWELKTARELFSIPTRVYRAEFSPDGTRLATVGDENVARVWEVKTGREILTLKGHGSMVDVVAFSADGYRIATGSRNGVVKIWSAGTGREVLQGDAWTWGPTISPDGKRIASASFGLDMRVWDAESGHELVRFRPDLYGILSAQFSPDGRFILTGGGEKIARLWDSFSGRLIRQFEGHESFLTAVTFNSKGNLIATGSADKTIRIWDVQSGRTLQILKGHTSPVYDVFFSPDDSKLISAATEPSGHVWDVKTGRLQLKIVAGEGPMRAIQFSRDGRKIFTGSSLEKLLKVWDSTSGRLLETWAVRNPVVFINFSPDGTRMVTTLNEESAYGSGVALAQIWDVHHRREISSLQGHSEPIWLSMFNSNGSRILTSSADMTTRQWETFPWRESEYEGCAGKDLPEKIASYARQYWRKRLLAEANGPGEREFRPVDPQFIWDRSRWPMRDPKAGPAQLDLTPHYTGVLDANFYPGFNPYYSDTHLGALKPGLMVLSNITFDVRGVVQLQKFESLGGAFRLNWEKFPREVSGIRVGRGLKRVHLLHGTSSWGIPPDGTRVASLVLRYQDATEHPFEIEYGRDVRNWDFGPNGDSKTSITRATVAWSATNHLAIGKEQPVRLFLSTFENPKPASEVTSIDLISTMTEAAPFMIAITVE